MSFESQRLDELLDAIGAKAPTPGGGAVAGVVAALAAALGRMVVAYSEGKASLAAHAPLHRRAAEAFRFAQHQATRLADDDAAAYAALSALLRLPETDERRRREMHQAVHQAIQVPSELIEIAQAVLAQLDALRGRSNRMLASDLAIAAILADAAAQAAAWNVRINLPLLGASDEAKETATRTDQSLDEIAQVRRRVEDAAEEAMRA